MSNVSRVQHLLGVIAHAKVNTHPVQMITSRLSSESESVQSTVPSQDTKPAADSVAAWDPHDVWVNRVKKPREKRSA